MNSQNQPLVAVILLNWNGLADTIECVQSLTECSFENLQVYIVDNASANNEGEILSDKFPSATILMQKENLGFCKGNNVGIEQAIADGAEYIMLLNNDTIVTPASVAILVDEFKKIGNAGALSPVIMEYPEMQTVWFAEAKWDASRAQFSLNPRGKTLVDLKIQDHWNTEFACGCCLFTTATIMKEVGLLDERYFAYYDEADWCKRLDKKGYSSFTTSKAVIYHKVSKTTPKLVSTYLMTRNRLLWMKDHLPMKKRMASFFYLGKEYLWHVLNRRGLLKGSYSKAYSIAFLKGCKDYQNHKFWKWDEDTEKLIF